MMGIFRFFVCLFLLLLSLASLALDTDNDGLPDSYEASIGTDPNNADSDGDGVGDNSDAFPNDATEMTDSDSDGSDEEQDLEGQQLVLSPQQLQALCQ